MVEDHKMLSSDVLLNCEKVARPIAHTCSLSASSTLNSRSGQDRIDEETCLFRQSRKSDSSRVNNEQLLRGHCPHASESAQLKAQTRMDFTWTSQTGLAVSMQSWGLLNGILLRCCAKCNADVQSAAQDEQFL